MIRVNNISKRYGKKVVLSAVSIELDQKTYGLIGPNGAGKTTLIRILAGTLRKDSGKIVFKRADAKIGYLPQFFGCFPELTVREQMEYFACVKDLPAKAHEESIAAALRKVDMYAHADMKCGKLSGGMTRRVGIAQALLGDPDILLLDEPTVGLDPEERVRFRMIMKRVAGAACILISSHIVEDVQFLCDGVIVMNHGEIISEGTPKQIAGMAQGHDGHEAQLEDGYMYLLKHCKVEDAGKK